jgi:hypothetical protein
MFVIKKTMNITIKGKANGVAEFYLLLSSSLLLTVDNSSSAHANFDTSFAYGVSR